MRREYYEALYKALMKDDVIRRTSIDGSNVELLLNDETIYVDSDEKIDSYYEEKIKSEPHVVIFGAGHVAKALYDMALLLEMKVTVIDEREEVLNEERFPKADRILTSYEKFFSSSFSFFRPYFVIVTHGHAWDKEALVWCLKRPYSYLGMIGSKRKVALTYEEVMKEGFSLEELKTVHSPIGLNIGAEGPEEIALSILSEIISVFRKEKNFIILDPNYLKNILGKKGAFARIIKKSGSAPRSIGSELFYSTEEDKFYGTVGGGRVEKECEMELKKLRNNEHKIVEYNLSKDGELNMYCGGDVTVLFSSIS